jgi:hypothetical protein
MNGPSTHWRGLIVCLLSGATLPAAAQGLYMQQQQEPQWLSLDFISGSLGVYTEGQYEKSTYNGAGSENYSHLFIGPELGLNLDGSIYHPNLARFTLSTEGALGQGWDNSSGSKTSDFEYLGNALASFDLLGNKPYATTVSASTTHTYTQYDFFSQTTVDTYRYGFQTGYREGSSPFNLSYWHTKEDTSGLNNNFNLDQDTLNFDISKQRDSGSSRFFYGLNDFSQNGMGVQSSGVNQVWGVSDNETLGRRKNMNLNSDASYSLLDSPGDSGDDINANIDFNVDHTPSLWSGYDVGFGQSTYSGNNSDNYYGSASLRHQLYQSLTSSLNFNGQDSSSSGTGGSSDSRSYSTSLDEDYTKRLSTWGQLIINAGAGYSYTDISQNGGAIPINDQPYTFTGIGIQVPLLEPDVNPSSIKIYSNTSHTFLYPAVGNYTVTQNGQITYITLVAGTLIPLNTAVYISYTYSSSGTGSGSYDTMNEVLQVRMNLWGGLLGLYGRVNSIQNSGTAGLVLNNLTSYAVGADTAWHFLRAGAEYDVYDSSLSSYNSARLYQTLSFLPSPVSQLSFGFAESWTTYSGNNQSRQQMYSFINRYHRTLSQNWGFDIEDGISQQNGGGTDQTLATVRPGLEFAKGKFSLRIGYDFEYSQYLSSETRYYQTFFLRAKRTF